MKLNILDKISCPNCKDHENVNLKIKDIWSKGQNKEILEGFIICENCNEKFPIIFGIPILVTNPEEYISNNFVEFLVVKSMFGNISSRMLSYISNIPSLIYTNKYITSSYKSIYGIGIYISMHYEEISDLLDDTEIDKKLCNLLGGQNFYQRCYEYLCKNFNYTTLAYDLGCNVGGMSYRLSFDFNQVISLDLSFLMLSIAKILISHIPFKKSNYTIIREALNVEKRNIDLIKRNNVEFLLGDINNLCLKNNLADCITTFNMLEVTSNPVLLIKENKRVLSQNGLYSLTTPFYWRPDRTPIKEWIYEKDIGSSNSLIKLLKAENFIIGHIYEKLPWFLRFYDRYFQVWLNDLVIAFKNEKK